MRHSHGQSEITSPGDHGELSPADSPSAEEQRLAPVRTISGAWLVLAMLLAAVVSGLTLVGYAHWAAAPFQPLREELLATFPAARPTVDGGVYKSHRAGPRRLRIIFHVDFDPERELARSMVMANTAVALASPELLSQFDFVELHWTVWRAEQGGSGIGQPYLTLRLPPGEFPVSAERFDSARRQGLPKAENTTAPVPERR